MFFRLPQHGGEQPDERQMLGQGEIEPSVRGDDGDAHESGSGLGDH
ncbi:hypothetical protein ABT339_15120 [Micromonospora sp. NPDC000119]